MINAAKNPTVDHHGMRKSSDPDSGSAGREPHPQRTVHPEAATPGPSESGGAIVFVPGPIGNLSDITLRALEELRKADVIACEDTRHSKRLLDRHGIQARLVSLHEHNEASRSAQLVQDARAGRTIAVLSDAGCPGISDPGGRLIQACLREGIPYRILPGPTALTVALVGSGLFADAFHFGGFLPPKSGRRERVLKAALERDETSVFFEAPHRLLKSLAVLAELEPERLICVARELTKTFEEFRRGTTAAVLRHFGSKPPKGEITLVISGRKLPPWIAPRSPSDAAANPSDTAGPHPSAGALQ